MDLSRDSWRRLGAEVAVRPPEQTAPACGVRMSPVAGSALPFQTSSACGGSGFAVRALAISHPLSESTPVSRALRPQTVSRWDHVRDRWRGNRSGDGLVEGQLASLGRRGCRTASRANRSCMRGTHVSSRGERSALSNIERVRWLWLHCARSSYWPSSLRIDTGIQGASPANGFALGPRARRWRGTEAVMDLSRNNWRRLGAEVAVRPLRNRSCMRGTHVSGRGERSALSNIERVRWLWLHCARSSY